MNNGGKVLVVGTGVTLAGLGVWALTRKKAGASGTPTITVVPSSPTAGVLFDFDFSGWLPNSTIQVAISNLTTGAPPQSVTVTVDSNGNSTLPTMAQNAATYRVDATGESGQSATLTFTVVAPPPPPPPSKANLYGRIYDSASSQGIPGAVVVLTAADGTSINATADSTGAYLFSNLPANITVSWGVAAQNYVSASGTLTLLEGNNPKDISLVAIPPPANNIITFGNLTGQRVQAIDAGGNPLSFWTCNLDCIVSNQGPATIRQIQVWRSHPGLNDAISMSEVDPSLPMDGSAPIAYRGNPVGPGKVLLDNTPADVWMQDAGSGSMSNKVRI